MLVIAGYYGRLGNCLTRLAHIVAFAFHYQVPMINLSFTPFAAWFEGTQHHPLCGYPTTPLWVRAIEHIPLGQRAAFALMERGLRSGVIEHLPGIHVVSIGANTLYKLDEAFYQHHVAGQPYVVLDGYQFRNHELVNEHAELIRQWLRPVGKLRQLAQYHLSPLKEQTDVQVGVNIRHGDYRTFRNGRYFFDTQTYIDRMRAIQAWYAPRSVGFFVTSDEPQDPNAFREFHVVMGNDPVVDFATTSQCHSVIGTQSSYSRAAAFWGNIPMSMLDNLSDEEIAPQFVPMY